jgi:hypothetical protein
LPDNTRNLVNRALEQGRDAILPAPERLHHFESRVEGSFLAWPSQGAEREIIRRIRR